MILCCGEALIDMMPAPMASGGDGFQPCCGGSVFNTAIALGRLGVAAGMLSGVSSDVFGQRLLSDLHRAGVDTAHLIVSPRPTTLAFVHVKDGQASYSFYDENSAGRMFSADDIPALSENVAALFFGGISLSSEPAADAYATLAETVGHDRVIILDPNIRPNFIENEARYRARLEALLARADIVKASDEDLNWIIPGADGPEAKAAQLCARFGCLFVMTRGPKGASAWLPGGEVVSAPGQNVTVCDTVGAGDTFNAGFLAALEERGMLTHPRLATVTSAEVKRALAFGILVASITVSRVGADPPWRGDLAVPENARDQ